MSPQRRTIGCKVINGRESGKTKAEDAADMINKRNIRRVHETYGKEH